MYYNVLVTYAKLSIWYRGFSKFFFYVHKFKRFKLAHWKLVVSQKSISDNGNIRIGIGWKHGKVYN
jgi:hypothetical protein